MIRFHCPACGQSLKADPAAFATCVRCGATFPVPVIERNWETDPPPTAELDYPEESEPVTYAPMASPMPKWVILLGVLFGLSLLALVVITAALKIYTAHVQSKVIN